MEALSLMHRSANPETTSFGGGQQHPMTARARCFRFTPINRPFFKLICSPGKWHRRPYTLHGSCMLWYSSVSPHDTCEVGITSVFAV